MSCSYLKSAHVPKRTEDMSSFSIGQMNQLANALIAAGYTPEHVTRLGQHRQLRDIRNMLDGCGELCVNTHLIDCDTPPFVPYSGSKWIHHRKGGQFFWDNKKVKLYWWGQQEDGVFYGRHDLSSLSRENSKFPVLNANMLDYLLDHPYLIPEEWKYGKKGDRLIISFWGTHYVDHDRREYIRTLCFSGGHWEGGIKVLSGGSWGVCDPAVMYKK